jgi:hypothetical protein
MIKDVIIPLVVLCFPHEAPGQWSKGDVLALIGVVAAILAIPGMPKLLQWDSEKSSHVEASGAAGTTAPPKPAPAAPVRVPIVRDVSSGQVNFGCDQTLPVETSIISFGKNPKDIETRAAWLNTDNVKTQNQAVVNIEDPADHHVSGVKAMGSISV